MIEIIIGFGATAVCGIVAWTGKRLVSKIDRMDVVVRGDGNGAPGLGERIRDVHQEVKYVRRGLEQHVAQHEREAS